MLLGRLLTSAARSSYNPTATAIATSRSSIPQLRRIAMSSPTAGQKRSLPTTDDLAEAAGITSTDAATSSSSSSPTAKKAKLQATATEKVDAAASKAVSPSKRLDGDGFDDLDTEALIAAAEEAEEDGAHSHTTQTKLPFQQSSANTKISNGSPNQTAASASFSDELALERQTMDPLWFSRLEPEMKKPTFKALKNFLESEVKRKETIYPPRELIHSWSRLTPLDKVKVVVVGQDPYHGPGQACGMSFSVPKGVPVPGSLKNIYKELSTSYPSTFSPPKHGNLESWAKQGVLLLNASLTVRAHQAASHHGKGWEPFTKSILKLIGEEAAKGVGKTPLEAAAAGGKGVGVATAAKGSKLMGMFKKVEEKNKAEASGGAGQQNGSMADQKQTQPSEKKEEPTASSSSTSKEEEKPGVNGGSKGVVFLAWGLPAAKTLADAGITERSPNVLLLKSAHPSPLSAHRGFLGNGHFKKANDWLEDPRRYGPGGGIHWEQL